MKNKKNKKKNFFKKIKNSHLPTILAFLLFYFILCMISFIIIRNSGIEEHNGHDVSFWAVLTTNLLTLVGNGYYFDETPGITIIGITLLLTATISVSFITGAISSIMVENKLGSKKGLKKMQKLNNHIIICGWNSDVKNLILSIVKKNNSISCDDIVLINNIDEVKINALLADEELKGLHYLRGDFTDEQTILLAKAKEASKVLILGENHESLDAELVDSRVFVSTLMFRNVNPKCHICVEVKTERYKNYLESQNCAEVIYSDAYTRYILSTSTNYSGMSKVMNALLDNGNGVCVVIEKIDEKWYGKTYAELAKWYKDKHNLMLGILQNMGLESEIKHQILSDAQKSDNYGEIIKNLKTVKNMETNLPLLNPSDDLILTKNMGAIILGDE